MSRRRRGHPGSGAPRGRQAEGRGHTGLSGGGTHNVGGLTVDGGETVGSGETVGGEGDEVAEGAVRGDAEQPTAPRTPLVRSRPPIVAAATEKPGLGPSFNAEDASPRMETRPPEVWALLTIGAPGRGWARDAWMTRA
ncbi:hypothetical protein GCM10009753_75230 [Streptantibioticus ferralitis]